MMGSMMMGSMQKAISRPLPELKRAIDAKEEATRAAIEACEREWRRGALRCGVRVRPNEVDSPVAQWFVRLDTDHHNPFDMLTADDLLWLRNKRLMVEGWCNGVIDVLPPSEACDG